MPPVMIDLADDAGEPGGARWWQERQARLARRRPRTDGLTIERIIEVAVAIVDEEGLEALTVRRLAARLDTGSATLYRHVASRAELLVLLIDHVLGEVHLPPASMAPRARVEHLAAELRRVLLRHPNLVPALRASPLLGPNAVTGADNGLANLIDAGYPPEVAVPACLALIDYVLGSVFFDSGRAHPAEPDPFADSTLHLDPRDLAALTGEGVFAFGLRVFLDGLETLVP
jgi:AcrR family transcriptional regulator